MLRQSAILHKKPVVFKFGNSSFTNQLKNMLSKTTPHRSEWGSLEQYEPRNLAHVNKTVEHYNYSYKYDPHYAPWPALGNVLILGSQALRWPNKAAPRWPWCRCSSARVAMCAKTCPACWPNWPKRTLACSGA